MRSLENRLFKHTPTYQNKLIKRVIAICRFGNRSERVVKGYKLFLFKMMGELVKKNILNYEKLMSNLPRCPSELSRDEMISEAYMLLDLCIKKFKPTPVNNFYFYFNKSLSRNFYRRYQKYSLHTHVEVTEEMLIVNKNMHVNVEVDTMSVLFRSLNFTEIEIQVIHSRLQQQSMANFCRSHIGVSRDIYRKTFESVKAKMIPYLSEFKNIKYR